MNHHRAGAGEPLLLLHGVGHRWGAWAPVLPDLERTFDVIACDSPGFGGSEPLPAGVPRTISAMSPPMPAVETCVSSGPARSRVRRPSARVRSTAASIASASAATPREWRRSMAALRMAPMGLATPRPAMSGADPWMGS